jgi:hypothetical protein
MEIRIHDARFFYVNIMTHCDRISRRQPGGKQARVIPDLDPRIPMQRVQGHKLLSVACYAADFAVVPDIQYPFPAHVEPFV